jgi:putative addiction module component (TIGR02574 family)
MAIINNIFEEALNLRPSEKAQLIDKLLSSLDTQDKDINELRAKEVEERIDAYEQGKIKAISLENILQKYKKTIKINFLVLALTRMPCSDYPSL